MATITEDYVSFETAKLLKDKGFDEPCFCINYPLPEGGHRNIILQNLLNNSMIPFTDEYKFCRYKEDFITIPTLQMAMKWLREVHNIGVFPSIYASITGSNTIHVYGTAIVNLNTYELMTYDYMPKDTFPEACEVAIKYCLENLI